MGSMRWFATLACLSFVPSCAFWELSTWSDHAGSDAADAGPVPVAFDTFTRTLGAGLGSAEIGGAWTLSTLASTYDVQDFAAHFTVDTGKSIESYLFDVSALDVDVSASFSTSKTPDSNGIISGLVARMMATGDREYYSFALRVSSAGVAAILKLRDGTELVNVNVPRVSNLPGKIIRMRMQLSGSSPTHLRVRAWMDDTQEPSTWDVETTDSSPLVQVPGGVGLVAYVSASSTIGSVVATYDDFIARPIAPF